MLHGFNFSKLVLLSTLIFTYSNASNSQLLQHQGPILWVCGAHPIKLLLQSRDLFQMVRSRKYQKKRIER